MANIKSAPPPRVVEVGIVLFVRVVVDVTFDFDVAMMERRGIESGSGSGCLERKDSIVLGLKDCFDRDRRADKTTLVVVVVVVVVVVLVVVVVVVVVRVALVVVRVVIGKEQAQPRSKSKSSRCSN